MHLVHDAVGHDMNEFRCLLKRSTESFIEMTLHEGFGSLIDFVKRSESMISSQSSGAANAGAARGRRSAAGSAGGLAGIEADEIERLVRNFGSSWKSGIEQMNSRCALFERTFETLISIQYPTV